MSQFLNLRIIHFYWNVPQVWHWPGFIRLEKGAEEEFYGDRGIGGGNSLVGQESSETNDLFSSFALGDHIH